MTNHADTQPPVLVVDDDPGLLLLIKTTLVSQGMPEPMLVSDSRLVMDLIQENQFRVVLLDLNMPHVHGMEILRRIKETHPATECIIISAVDEVETATQAMKIGAYDYIVKPIKGDRLTILIKRALEKYNLRQELTLFEERQTFESLKHPEAFREMIARDEAMALVFRQAEIVAPTDYSVIIAGESGTGKEKLARVIHDLSLRSKKPVSGGQHGRFQQNAFRGRIFRPQQGCLYRRRERKGGVFRESQRGFAFSG